MNTHQSAAKPPRWLNALVIVGDVLWLQLLFVTASLLVVTMFPAAVALQRSLRELLLEGHPRPMAVFWRNLVWAWQRTWKVALLPPMVLVAAVVSLLFWLAANSVVGVVALCIVIPLYGVALAAYLAVLASSTTAEREDSLRDWCAGARMLVRTRALPLALSIVVMGTWFLLLAQLPTLLLVGTGLVPAALAWWVARPWIQRYRKARAA
ncbi:hypothetical protein [Psychromicrobium xiongbiense]|uniref:hypothetical protein n=1 Tax=Psychromicrobium xiongbiense TaxID=3051184 RepID=UPI002556E8ED|nr:hypothetical protein [Psychromicrobium sp. YIM S02556]